jgi:DNA-binding NarL/FixJ family response regulator
MRELKLNEKEVEVLQKLLEGESPKSLAEKLDCCLSTISKIKQVSRQKLGARSDLELAIIAFKKGYLKC